MRMLRVSPGDRPSRRPLRGDVAVIEQLLDQGAGVHGGAPTSYGWVALAAAG